MTNASDQSPLPDVPDEDLPEDLRPTDDNPLAQPLDDDAGTDLDVLEGKTPEQWDDEPGQDVAQDQTEGQTGGRQD